jgi:hypothetical protein
MRYGFKDPLAATRRENTRERMQRQRESMTGPEVEAAMEKIVRSRLAVCEDVGLSDFHRANLPMDKVRECFDRVKARVRVTL